MLPSAHTSRELGGTTTEVLLLAYADRILVLVTQLGKVGHLVQATIPATTPLDPPPPPDPSQPDRTPLPVPPPAIQLTPLLGGGSTEHMQTLYSLYATHIATLVWIAEAEEALESERRAVVVGLALRKASNDQGMSLTEHEKEVFHGAMDIVRELLHRK